MDMDKMLENLEVMLDTSRYQDSVAWNPYADTETLENVIALLKSQQPRLLTLDDFIGNPDVDAQGRLHCWVEYKSGEYAGWSFVSDWDLAESQFKRYWTSRPSDAQRKAIPWPDTAPDKP